METTFRDKRTYNHPHMDCPPAPPNFSPKFLTRFTSYAGTALGAAKSAEIRGSAELSHACFEHKVDMTIHMLTMYRFFDK